MSMVIATFQALLVELLGVGLIAGVLYIYWNLMTKVK